MDLDSAWTWIKIHRLGLSLRDTLEIHEKDPGYCLTCTDIVTFLETWIWTLHGLGLRFTDLDYHQEILWKKDWRCCFTCTDIITFT